MNSNLISKFRAIEKIGTEVEAPFIVTRTIGTKRLAIMGDQVSIGHDDCDYVSVGEARLALEWYVEQLGGVVKWSKK